MRQEENVRCFLGLNVAPSHPHWSWFNIKAIKSQLLLSQYIVSELKLSSGPVNLIFFKSFFTVAWQWFFFQLHFCHICLVKAVKQKQKIKESHRCCWGINCWRVGFHFITLPRDPKHFPLLLWHSVPNSQCPASLKPVQHCFSSVDGNGPAENIQMSHPWFIVVPHHSWYCVILCSSDCLEVRFNRTTS